MHIKPICNQKKDILSQIKRRGISQETRSVIIYMIKKTRVKPLYQEKRMIRSFLRFFFEL